MMRVQVEVLCAPYPVASIEESLRAAGRQLALLPDSVCVKVRDDERLIAVLEFEMRRAAQYRAVDDVYATVKHWAWAFYEDITIRFPKD